MITTPISPIPRQKSTFPTPKTHKISNIPTNPIQQHFNSHSTTLQSLSSFMSQSLLKMHFLFLIMLSLFPNPSLSSHCTTQTLTKTYQKCMALPTQQASLAWTFHPKNSTLEIAFFGSFISPSGWVGWGINPASPGMTGARALIAFPDPNSGSILLLPFVLDPSVKLQRGALLSRPLDIRLTSSSATLYGGKLATVHDGAAVQIHAALRLPSNSTTKIHIVWNRGLYVQGYSPTIHPTTPADLSSAATIDILSASASAAHGANVAFLRTLHGAINAISWGLLLPAGAVTARYLRHVQSLGPTWFYVHMGIQLTGFVLGTAGFAIGVRLGAMSPGGGAAYGLHRKLGFAAFCLGAVQAVALVFRPRTTHKFRRYWKSYHHLVGYACVVVGVVNVFQGFEAMGEGGSYSKLGYCLCLAALVGGCVSLEVNSWVVFCRKAKEEKLRREGFVAGPVGSDKGSGIIHH